MCCSGGPGGIRLTRCGVVCGIAALAALSTALLGPAWLHTEEKLNLPYLPRNFANVVTVRFKLGLFRVCPRIVKPANLTVREYFIFLVSIFFEITKKKGYQKILRFGATIFVIIVLNFNGSLHGPCLQG